jgi:uncharacterized protein YaaW (UPF0174 family)
MNSSEHIPHRTIVHLKKIDTTELDKSVAIVPKNFTQLLMEQKNILIAGLLDLHRYLLKKGDWDGAEIVSNTVTKSFAHK